MAFVSWVPDSDGDWDTGSNWSTGVVPTSNDTVTISTTDIHTITHSTGNDFAKSLSVGNDVFAMTGGSLDIIGTMSVVNAFAMSGGLLIVGGKASITNSFTLSGGILAAGSLSVTGNFTQTGGSLTTTGTVSIGGNAQLQGGYLGGSVVLQVGGTVVFSSYTMGGNAQITNAKTIDQTGNLTLGDNSGVGVTITNSSTGTYEIANAVTIARGAASAQFTNAGLLTVVGGAGTSTDNVSTTNTGTISVGAGSALVLAGPLTNLGGTITGGGTLVLGGGSATIAATTALSVAQFDVEGATTLVLGGNLTVSGGYYESGPSSVAFGGHVLALTGAAQFVGSNGTVADIGGAGTLVTRGATSLTGNSTALIIGGTAVWNNYSTVTQSESLQLGDSNAGAAALTNEKTGVFDVAVAGDRIFNGSTPVSGLTNLGTLAITATGGTGYIAVNVTSSGAVTAAQGDNLEFDGPANSFAGKLAGAGQISFGAGASTIAAGTTISVAALAIYDNGTSVVTGGSLTVGGSLSLSSTSTLTLGGNLTISGSYSQLDSSTVALGGFTLTTAGTAQFQYRSGDAASPFFTGSGTLATRGTTTLINGGTPLVIGGSVAWDNYGTVLENGSLLIGAAIGVTASITNEASGVFDILADGISINNGSTPVSTIVSLGTFELTANGAGVGVGVNVSSSGAIISAAGDLLEFDGAANSFAGSLTGAGQIAFGQGMSTIAAGTTISVATLAIYRSNGNVNTAVTTLGSVTVGGALSVTSTTTLTLGGNMTVSGGYSQLDSSTVALGGFTLTTAGAAQFQQRNGSPAITGSGTLATRGITTLINGGTPLVIGGSVTWDNYGTVLDNGSLLLGASSGAVASLTIEGGGVFDILAGGISVSNGSTPVSTIANLGTFELTANGGGVGVGVNVSSSGAIISAAGDNLEFDGAANSFAGSLAGAGQIAFGQGMSTIAAGTTISVATLAIYRSNGNVNTAVTTLGSVTVGGALSVTSTTTLTLGGNMTVSGGYSQLDSSTVALGGFTLTLAGTAQFQQRNGSPGILGSGTLATRGTTTLINGGTPLVIGSSVAWDNYGTVLESGSLQIGNSSAPAASLVNEAGALFDIITGGIAVANGSTPTSTLTNAGTFEMTATGGSSTLGLNVINTGTILAVGGGLTLAGSVSGAGGLLEIGAAGAMGFTTGTVTAGQTVEFLGTTGSLSITLATATSFAGKITGFVQGDTIDLTNVAFANVSSETFTGGVLTLANTSGQALATLHFAANPSFAFASDGHGGTLITDPPLGRAALGLSDRMYFGETGRPETIALTGGSEVMIGGFSYANHDTLDLRLLLAGMPVAHDVAALGNYLTAEDSGRHTTLFFDPSGHGQGSAVALLSHVTTSVGELMAHHALILS